MDGPGPQDAGPRSPSRGASKRFGARWAARGASVALVALVALALAGCDDERDYDAYPIALTVSGGALLGGADVGEGVRPVAIDVLAPVSSIAIGDDPLARRVLVDLTLHGIDPGGGTVPRSRVIELPILDVAPCAAPPCRIGPAGAGEAIEGVIGADVLSAGGRAARLDLARGELTFFAGIAGEREERTELCEAVMADPFGGGGTLLVGGAEVNYAAWRPVLNACLADEGGFLETGTDVVLALSTAVGQSLLAASAWDRLAARAELGLPAAAALPRGELLLPSGPIQVRFGTVPHLALVGDLGSASQGRGACRELMTNRLMSKPAPRGCGFLDTLELEPGQPVPECPCPDGEGRVCDAGAAVELGAPLAVAVVDDGNPILQSLRDELRPALAELDGILGVDALAALRIDLDYPNNRLLIRCLAAEGCTILPEVLDSVRPDRGACLVAGDGEPVP